MTTLLQGERVFYSESKILDNWIDIFDDSNTRKIGLIPLREFKQNFKNLTPDLE